MQTARPLGNIQQELLKLYNSNIDDADLENTRHILASYFSEKAIKEADDIWDNKGYSSQTMEQWLHEDDKGYKKIKLIKD